MIDTSVEFRKTMHQRTNFKPSASILFADGRMVNLTEHDLSINGNELTDGAESNSFPLGVAIGRAFSMEIRNQDQRFEDYSFYMATVRLQLHFELNSGTEETIYLGKFTITTPETYGATIAVQAVDNMYRANTNYSTQLVFPTTLGEMVRDCCSQCGLPLGSATFKNSNFSVKTKPENISCREVLAQAAMIAGGYAKVDRNGYLQICSYDLSVFEREGAGDGGSFDNSENAELYVDGDNIDGGNFDDYSSGDAFDSGTFLSMDNFHMFYDFLSPPQTDADDVVITGIQITDTAGKTYLCGEEGYILSIENQLAKGNEQSAVNAIGKLINGFKFRAFSGEYIGYPIAEFGDICYVIDQNGNTYQSILTDITYRFNGKTSLKCSADSPLRNSSKIAYNSDYIRAVIAARNYTDQEMSAYDLVVQQMSQLAANTLGFHETKIIQDDGSVIVYRHDKPKLSESKIVYKSGIGGFFVTKNYTGKDSTTVWKAGFDSDGNAALNILSVIGIHWDWAYGGTLSLGGVGNGNGVLKAYDAKGKLVATLSNDGLQFYNNKGLTTTLIQDGEIIVYKDPVNYDDISAGKIVDYSAIRILGGSITPVSGGLELDEEDGSITGIEFEGYGISINDEESDYIDGTFKNLETEKFSCSNGDVNLDSLEIKNVVTIANTPNQYDTYATYYKEVDFRGGITLHKYPTVTTGYNCYINMNTFQLSKFSSSSERYKILGAELSKEFVENLYNIKPIMARYKDGYLDEHDERVGIDFPMFNADDVNQYFPLAVDHVDGKSENWNERIMIPAMFAMIKQQKEEIESLKQAVEEMRGN
nr:hypothetical protein [uncultured Blautia sp.]